MAPSFHLTDFESTQRLSSSSSSLAFALLPALLIVLSLAHGGPAFCVTVDVWILGLVRFLPIPVLSLQNSLITILASLFADVVLVLIPKNPGKPSSEELASAFLRSFPAVSSKIR